jgi:hypothetical protein
MCDDPAVLRLLTETEAAGAKLIIVGDHRQLGAVGPGGSLEALVTRHQGSVHALRQNVRQADPDERAMLAQLRAGSVEEAVNWYADHGRIDIAAGRDQALNQTVAAWAKDMAEGRQSTIMARRRANVTALNARAREAMRQAGRLSGPELQVAGNSYQAGDRIVTLEPSAGGQLVTSQRGQVTAVLPHTGGLTVRMGDGQIHTLGPGQIGPDQLALGYATTVTNATQTVFGRHLAGLASGFISVLGYFPCGYWVFGLLGLGRGVARRWGVEGDAEVDFDLPPVDLDAFDEEANESLLLVEVEVFYAVGHSGGEVVDAVA